LASAPDTINRPQTPLDDDRDLASGPVAVQSLEAQAALLRYALALFGIALPIFGWAASFAADRNWAPASLAVFAINWAAFYATLDWLKRRPENLANVGLRTRVHILGGLLWAVAVAQLTSFAAAAGLARESIMLLALGAAVVCIFFSAPLLPALLVVGPAAAAAPVAALFLDPQTRPFARPALAAVALAMALSLILNRLLRRQFALAAERERLIAERAHELARTDKLAKSKSALLATLSNEIRNGLTGVVHVLAAATGAGGRSAPSREQLAAALSATEDLVRVLDATLDMETAQAGRLALNPRPLDLAGLAQELVLLSRPQAAAKGLEISLHVESDFPAPTSGAVLGDPARVRQILGDLTANAVKYTVRGRIELRLTRLSGRLARLEVVDTGPGLTPAELLQAFEPFERVARTAAGVPGAGLGLPLARQLAELMGGVLSAESAAGVGCCFRLDLPYDPAARLAQPGEPATEAVAASAHARALRVLVAMEDALQTAMLRAVLEQLGHQVLQAHDGQRACDLAQACDVDLIMLDGRLPVMDGPQTARAIRGLPGPMARTPIIAIIGGEPEEASACLEAGVDQVLRKPVSVAGVARALTEAMREDRAPRRRPRAPRARKSAPSAA
jgi:signal transduction histidine kinase/ActR/RegA family two-component response regulator